MRLFDRLFRREPDDLESAAHAQGERAASVHEHGLKGIELATQSLGLLRLRDVEPQSPVSGLYYPRVEGDLMVDDESFTLTLVGSASSRPNRGGSSSDLEYRVVHVAVLSGLQKLGNISYDWSSSFEDASEEKYQLITDVYGPEISQADFLRGIQQAARRTHELAQAQPAAAPYPAPSLSAIEEVSVGSETRADAPSPNREI